MIKLKIAVNGYGVIGKRLADAVLMQDDMELIGVTARTPDVRLIPAMKKNIPIFAVDGDSAKRLNEEGYKVEGNLQDLLKKIDVVLDSTPKGVGAENKQLYEKVRIKSIFQGGEKHELTDLSFVSEVNYQEAINKSHLRVVSCNTTAICRVTNSFIKNGLLDKAIMTLVRRGADPIDSHKQGPMGTIALADSIPSHHGPDAQTVNPNLDIITMAVNAPTTIGHLHMAYFKLNWEITKQEAVEMLNNSQRVIGVKYSDGLTAENQVAELMRDLGRPRADMWEVIFWEDLLYAEGNEVAFYYQVHNEAIVIPENIDAIRALTGVIEDPITSINKTNHALGIINSL